MEKKYLLLLITLFIQTLYGQTCYQSYNYSDAHHIKTKMIQQSSSEVNEINGTLHVRYLENNGTSYYLFWLENGITDKSMIDIHSLYVPFLIKTSDIENTFLIHSMKMLSRDRNLYQKLIGMVDSLQYQSVNGLHRFKNASGSVDVNQSSNTDILTIRHLKQYKKNVIQKEVEYLENYTELSLDKDACRLWKDVKSNEEVKFTVAFMDAIVKDERNFELKKSKPTLPLNHWFFTLNHNPSSWGFPKKHSSLSLNDAFLNFDNKTKEMLKLLNDSQKFETWVKENMDFLEHLSEMLESKELDDQVSQALFSKLGYIDSYRSSAILAKVSLNVNILEKERFRGLMGLKNTSAPLDSTVVNELIEYSFSSPHGNSFIQNTAGMLLGTLAKERAERDPEVFEQISDAIITAIETQANKNVALTSAGNMKSTAPNRVVDAVEKILFDTTDSHTKTQTAQALSKIERSNLDSKTFQGFFENEENIETISALIRASASAKDFKSNMEFQEVLVNLSGNKVQAISNRLASLETLSKTGFANNQKEKQLIRKMMIGERDSKISKQLKVLYRR